MNQFKQVVFDLRHTLQTYGVFLLILIVNYLVVRLVQQEPLLLGFGGEPYLDIVTGVLLVCYGSLMAVALWSIGYTLYTRGRPFSLEEKELVARSIIVILIANMLLLHIPVFTGSYLPSL